MLHDSYKFINTKRVFSHSGSQIGWYLGNIFGKNINFIGKVEQFDKDWNKLINKCNLEQSSQTETKNKAAGVTEIFHSWRWREKPKQIALYAKALGITFDINKLNLTYWNNNNGEVNWNDYLPPAYFAIADDENLYNKIVEYYWQDFVCLKYDVDFESFRKYVHSKKNINQIVWDHLKGLKIT